MVCKLMKGLLRRYALEKARLTQFHGGFDVGASKLDHDRISVTIYDLRIVLVSVLLVVIRLDFLLCRFNHLTTVCCRTRRDLKAGQLSDCRTSETVY